MALPKLTEDEIRQHLTRLPGWTRQGEAITRQYTFPSFARALKFVQTVGEAAESVDHHPDMDIRHAKVTLTLTTHFVRGLTRRDTQFAETADGVAEAAVSP